MSDLERIVGALGARALGRVGPGGHVELEDCSLDWLVGAEDRWHDPRFEAAVRQHRLSPAPAYETRVRIPSGDAVQRVYGVRARDGRAYAVVEVENASPAAFAIAFVLRAKDFRAGLPLALDGNLVRIGARPTLVLPRPPMRWAAGNASDRAAARVTSGAALETPFSTSGEEDDEVAFIYPMAHRTTFRVALALSVWPRQAAEIEPPAIDDLADAATVQRAWQSHLDRAMRVELPGDLTARVDAARATALLAGAPKSGRAVEALVEWGFEEEAAAAYSGQGVHLTRRSKPAKRSEHAPRWERMRAALAGDDDEAVLALTRRLLLWVGRKDVDLLPGFPAEWVGQNLAVHDAPTHAGPVSFALRWHGERPALLWDVPEKLTVRAPVLDPDWSAPGGTGETLLRPWAGAIREGESFA